MRLVALAPLAGALALVALAGTAPDHWLGEIAASFRWQIAGLCAAAAVVALAARARLAAAAGAVAALWCAWPVLALARGEPALPGAAPTLVVLSSNVLLGNPELETFRALLARERPDVVALLELDEAWRELAYSVRDRYPHRLVWPEPGSGSGEEFGRALLSRLPLEDARVLESGWPGSPILEARVRLGDEALLVRAVHPPRPGGAWAVGRREVVLDALEALPWPPRSVLMGDLNVAGTSPRFAALLDATGLADSRVGFGRQPSFVARRRLPLVRVSLALSTTIDHVLVGPGVGVVERRTLDVAGSDHRGVLARLALLPQHAP